jgi:hypothetical protein
MRCRWVYRDMDCAGIFPASRLSCRPRKTALGNMECERRNLEIRNKFRNNCGAMIEIDIMEWRRLYFNYPLRTQKVNESSFF